MGRYIESDPHGDYFLVRVRLVGALENNGVDKSGVKPSQLDLIAASLRLNNADIEGSLSALVEFLNSLSPSGITVKRRKKALFSKNTSIAEVTFRLKDQIFSISDARSATTIKFSRSKVVRDIVIKTDELAMDKWAAALAHQISVEAEQSENTRSTINRILGLN